MRTSAIIIVFAFLFACKGAQSPEEKAVIAQSKIYENSPSDSTALALVQAISKYVDVHGTNDSTSARYILRAARVSAERQQWQHRQSAQRHRLHVVLRNVDFSVRSQPPHQECPAQPDIGVRGLSVVERPRLGRKAEIPSDPDS